MEADKYDQMYYIEKKDLRIDFLVEDDEDEMKDALVQEKAHENPLETSNVPITSSVTFDDFVNISFRHPTPSPGITLDGLASLQTLESRIDSLDQSSTSITTTTSKTLEAPLVAKPSPSPVGQGGKTI